MHEYYQALIRGDKRGLWPAVQRTGLRALSVPYAWAIGLRNWLYTQGFKRVHRAAVPVVSVGNLTAGGTGKTPCVEYVARFFRRRGVRVAILSRGYGAAAGRNDEAQLLEVNLPDVPHLQGPDRVALAHRAVEELASEILILDDGFQHRRLHRDLDLVLIDATAPWGYGYVLPRGLLREAPSSLHRADVILLTRCDQVGPEIIHSVRDRIHRLARGAPVIETSHHPTAWINAEKVIRPLEDLHDRQLAAFCGIGNPEAFRRTLIGLGLAVRTWRTFPDHHPYSPSDVEGLRAWARQQAPDCLVVTTQKDLVKLPLTHLGNHDLWALQIQLHVTAGQELLEEKLQEVLQLDS